MRIVSPYRPFAPESVEHQNVGPFNWVAALQMLQASADRISAGEVRAITDVDTDLKFPAFQYQTTHRRLMPWILEVALRYLKSDDFDQDTVMLSPDILVFGDLRPYFVGDLGVVLRVGGKYQARPLLNCAQWWRHDAKARLVAFYESALARAIALPERMLAWGADTVPLVEMLSPLRIGLTERSGLQVYGIDDAVVLHALTAHEEAALHAGDGVPWPAVPLVDFRYRRKQRMAAYFAATVGCEVPA